MKIKYLSTLLFGLFASLTVSAQQLKEFTLEDLNFGGHNYYNMVPSLAIAHGGATSLCVLKATLAIL